MDVRTGYAGRRRCWMGGLAVMLSACAHDPAPKARCHGPWVWVTPAAGPADGGPADGKVSKPRASHRAATPGSIHAPAQPAAAGHR